MELDQDYEDYINNDMIGKKLRMIRVARAKSLQVIADLAGISRSQLSDLERGERVPSLKHIARLAKALAVSPSDLLRLPFPAPLNGRTDAAIEEVRHALESVTQLCPDGAVCDVSVLTTRVDDMYEMRRRCRLDDVSRDLPGLIRDLHTTLATGRDTAAVQRLIVITHTHLTHMWLRDAGASTDLRRQSTALARTAAANLGDPVGIATAECGTAHSLVGSGMFHLAHRKLVDLPLPALTPTTQGVVGTLLLTTSMIAGLRDHHADAVAPMEAALDLVARTEPTTRVRDEWGFVFHPVDVGLYQMDLAMEADDPARALDVAAGLQPETHPWPERRAVYWIHSARALVGVGGRDREAVVALRRAEKLSEHHVHRSVFVRDVLSVLLTRARRDAVGTELRGLAFRTGLPV